MNHWQIDFEAIDTVACLKTIKRVESINIHGKSPLCGQIDLYSGIPCIHSFKKEEKTCN